MIKKARPGEFTSVLNGGLFDQLPVGIKTDEDRDRWYAFRTAYQNAREYKAPREFPLQVDVELNSECQMRCSFCVHGRETVAARRLGFDNFASVIHQGAPYGLCSIKFNYINEPLLLTSLPNYIYYAKSRGVLNTYFATNGLLLKGAMARDLINAGLDKIMISLDAVKPATFRAMRGSDVLARIERNIWAFIELRDQLGARNPLVRVNFLRTKYNAAEEDAFIARWEGLADMVGVQKQVATPDGEAGVFEPPAAGAPFGCSFPFKLVVVDSGGDILPCCTFNGRSMPLGNLSDISIAEAWASPLMEELRALHASGNGLLNPICAHCAGVKNASAPLPDLRSVEESVAR